MEGKKERKYRNEVEILTRMLAEDREAMLVKWQWWEWMCG